MILYIYIYIYIYTLNYYLLVSHLNNIHISKYLKKMKDINLEEITHEIGV